MRNTHEIEIAIDTPEADAFAAYLNNLGHDARIGRSTGDYVDGECTSWSIEASEIMRALWQAYCDL